MEVHEKRELLESINTLILRPAMADEKTLGTAIANFQKLVEHLTQGQLTILPVEKPKEPKQ